MLKDQPKFADPNGRSRATVPPTPKSTSIGEGDCGSRLGDISHFERPIGRKDEKTIRKNKATGKDVKIFDQEIEIYWGCNSIGRGKNVYWEGKTCD